MPQVWIFRPGTPQALIRVFRILYNWAITSYAPNGDVLAMTDSVMGSWTYSYDDFNRLSGGTATAGNESGLALGWTYDRYGNRWAQNASCASGTCTGISATQPQLAFGNNNQVSGWTYDADGNLLYDGRNSYTYDAEGRLITLNGQPTYVYDAEGRRVAKLGSNGAVTASYLLDLGGHQVTELNGSGTWMHSNVWAPGGKLLATYEGPGESAPNTYHFHLTDWLGTERMQTNASGNSEETCTSYPFGDGLECAGPAADATEHHFTGKERDPESGLDYFVGRYLNSNLGRFMTADWAAKPTAVPYADFGNPQSLNLFVYALNNPLEKEDIDGHDWRTFVQKANQWMADHPRTMAAAKAVVATAATAAAVAVVVAAAPVTVPAALAVTAVAIGGAGTAVAATCYTAAAITGKQDLTKGGDIVATITNPAGFATTVATGVADSLKNNPPNGNDVAGSGATDSAGNADPAETAASVYDAATDDGVAGVAGAVSLTWDALTGAASDAGQDQAEQPATDPGDPDPVLLTTPAQQPTQQQQPQQQQ